MIFAYKLYMLNSKTIALAIGQRAFTCRHVKLTEMLCLSDHQAIASIVQLTMWAQSNIH